MPTEQKLNHQKDPPKISEAVDRRKPITSELEVALNGVADAVMVLSLDLKIVWANSAALQQSQCALNDIKASHCYAVTHQFSEPCKPPDNACPVEQSLRTGLSATMQHIHTGRSGARSHVEVTVHPIRDKSGEIAQFVHISRDITQRVEAEEALRNETSLLEALFDAAPGLLYLYTQEGKLIRWNRQHETMTGYSSEELRTMSVSDWFDGEDLPKMVVHWNRVFDEGARVFVELNLKRKDGSKVPMLFTGVRTTLNGKPHLVGIGVDIAEQKKTEHEMNALRNELIHTSRATLLGEFSAALSHETNQPLAAILSNAQAAQRFLAKENVDLEEIRQIIADIVRDGARAGEIISRLRAVVGNARPKMERVDLKDALQEITAFAGDHLSLNDVALDLQCEPTLPALTADRIQIQQVILNCIMNACDAMKDSAVKEISITAALKEPDRVVISIKDTGTGISAESKETLFKAFYSTKKTGMGMGLSISRRIIAAHNGQIHIENRSKAGAMVVIELPVLGREA